MNVGLVRIAELLSLARARGASDLHLCADEPPSLRVDGRLFVLEAPAISNAAVEAYCADVLPADAVRRLAVLGTADAARRDGPGAPYRIHAFRTISGTRAAFRLHAPDAPLLERLNLPAIIGTFDAAQRSGPVHRTDWEARPQHSQR